MASLKISLSMALLATAACSSRDEPANNGSKSQEAVSTPSVSGPRKLEVPATPSAAQTSVVMTRNLELGMVKTGKPLPHRRIVLKRGQRIDVLGQKGISTFFGPVTIGPDGQTISGGGGQEGLGGFGSNGRIPQIGGTRMDDASAMPRASEPAPQPPVIPPPEIEPK